MGQEQLKVLEMVAAGKISPEEGERLLNALNANSSSSSRGKSSRNFEIGNIKIPNVDVGRLAEMAVDFQKTVVKTAKTAEGRIKKSKAGKYLEPKEYPISVEQKLSPDLPVQLEFNIQAGQLKLLGEMDEAGKLIVGRATCVPDAPVVVTEVSEFRQHVGLRHRLGSCWLRLADAPVYNLKLENAAADTRLDFTLLKVQSIKINNNAGNIDLRLGERLAHVELEITNNAGSVDLQIDSGFGLKIHSSGSLSSSNIENLGLSLVDGSYVSPDWNENARGVEILLAQNVANCSISWRGAKKTAMIAGMVIGDVKIGGDDDEDDDERPAQAGVSAAAAAATAADSAEAAAQQAEAQLDEADRMAEEANAAVSQVQADIERLSRERSDEPAPEEKPAAATPGSNGPDLPSSDL